MNKEAYFTRENIYQKTESFLRHIGRFPIRTKFNFVPDKSALLVLDMQEFFINANSHAYIPSADAIIDNINKLIKIYNLQNQPVIFTRHINTHENCGVLGKWWRDIITEENPLSKISSAVRVGKSVIIEKSRYDAFYGTKLEDILQSEKVRQVLITGVMMNVCCETTARSAFIRDFDVFVVADACAAYNKDFHLASLANLSFGFADIVTSRWIIEHVITDE